MLVRSFTHYELLPSISLNGIQIYLYNKKEKNQMEILIAIAFVVAIVGLVWLSIEEDPRDKNYFKIERWDNEYNNKDH